MRISVCIPCYEYKGEGANLLRYNLEILYRQTFRDFDVVISDQSNDGEVMEEAGKWEEKLKIIYYADSSRSASTNFNTAIKLAKGKIIKLLCQDDYLLSPQSLEIINNNFDSGVNFLATGYWHTFNRKYLFNYHFPQFNSQIHMVNTIGTPSCVAFRNFGMDIPEFDINITYAYDCDFYKSYIDKFGGLKMINDATIVNFLWEGSTTSSISEETIRKEHAYLARKHERTSFGDSYSGGLHEQD